MAAHDMNLTINGWAGTDPRYFPGGDGKQPYTQFRLGCTPRYFDARQGIAVDRPTTWFTVKVYRDLARNVAESVRSGDPLLVSGRLSIEEWDGEGEHAPRVTVVLTAHAVGHNMDLGVSRFIRTIRTSAEPGTPDADRLAAAAGPTAGERAPLSGTPAPQDVADLVYGDVAGEVP